MLLLFFCGSHRPNCKVCQCHGAHTPNRNIYERPTRRLALCAVSLLLLLHIHPNSTMRFLTIFSHKPSQTSESIVDAPSTTRTRSSTMITTLEQELGMWEPPKSGEQFFYSSRTPALIKSILLCIPRLTIQVPNPKTREAYHSGSRAASKPIFSRRTLGDLVDLSCQWGAKRRAGPGCRHTYEYHCMGLG
jgi:hypothetical protein